jgi:hypothetical protein
MTHFKPVLNIVAFLTEIHFNITVLYASVFTVASIENLLSSVGFLYSENNQAHLNLGLIAPAIPVKTKKNYLLYNLHLWTPVAIT